MHEMSIAVNIVEIAEQTAKNDNASKINKIVVEVGALSGIVSDALEFCYESACKGTMAEGSTLEIIESKGTALCDNCGFTFQATQIAVRCPKCNEYVINIQGGKELRVKSINVD